MLQYLAIKGNIIGQITAAQKHYRSKVFVSPSFRRPNRSEVTKESILAIKTSSYSQPAHPSVQTLRPSAHAQTPLQTPHFPLEFLLISFTSSFSTLRNPDPTQLHLSISSFVILVSCSSRYVFKAAVISLYSLNYLVLFLNLSQTQSCRTNISANASSILCNTSFDLIKAILHLLQVELQHLQISPKGLGNLESTTITETYDAIATNSSLSFS